ncbi:response regulator [Polaribacter gangjinensis]|uniref:Response regulator n=1 Tax=Polaribacter gangjinensis TaxID=574710 RepID=A0A2S7WDC5_9FLAO|nr:response regulator [Polaribacter gangjinensis]PQJ75630.1 response regulator [Polaribacter gangjinensis]
MKKLDTILLIDDDPATNFLHKYVLQKESCAENIVSFQSAEEALEYIKDTIKNGFHFPELIFLDINMPRMNGWEFIEEYNKISKQNKISKIVVMLTTSLDTKDREKAESIKEINEFLSKPLTPEKIHQVLESFNLLK